MDHLSVLAMLSKEDLVRISSTALQEILRLKEANQSLQMTVAGLNDANQSLQMTVAGMKDANQSLQMMVDANQSMSLALKVDPPSQLLSVGLSLSPYVQPLEIEEDRLEHSDENNIALRRLFVRNIPFGATHQDLGDAFSKYGNVEQANVTIQRNKSGYMEARGYGFVTFETAECANKALQDKNIWIHGRMTECYLASNGKVRPANRRSESS